MILKKTYMNGIKGEAGEKYVLFDLIDCYKSLTGARFNSTVELSLIYKDWACLDKIHAFSSTVSLKLP